MANSGEMTLDIENPLVARRVVTRAWLRGEMVFRHLTFAGRRSFEFNVLPILL